MTHPSCRIFRALPRARDLAAWALFGSTLDNCARLATVRAGAVPVLVLHGQDDGFIPIEQGRRVAQAGRDAGLDVTLVDFPNTGHVNVNGAEGFLRTLTSFLQGAPASGSGGGGGKSAAV
jgi:pimeloyl-ACP methyl ester carboxylesterase